MVERRTVNLENGLWKYNLASDKYYFSQGICHIFNLESQDFKSHDAIIKLIHPEDVDYYTSTFNEKIKKRQSFIVSYRIVLKDGTIKNIEENVDFLFDEDGKVASYCGIVSDITNFIILQDKKQEEYSLINSILRTLPNLIFVKDIDAGFKFTLVNDKFASFYGFVPKDIIGKYDKDISTPEKEKACYVTDNIASGHDITSPLISVEEIPITKKSVKYMQTIKFAHVINGTKYLICSAMDITDLVKAKQKAEESDKLKSAFLRAISHEVRTPMKSIIGYSQLVGDSKDKNEAELFCGKIRDESEELLNLITKIVYLAKLETVNDEFAYENIDVESLFSLVKGLYSKQIKDKHLDFVYEPHSTSCNIYSNKGGIMKLLKLFLENAINFTDKGSISMGYDMDNKNLRIWVKDTGIGIDKKNRKKVFKRFVKLDEFTPGTGIGLYISQKIVKSMKGKIGIDSEIGKGSLVWAELPLDNAEKQNDKNEYKKDVKVY